MTDLEHLSAKELLRLHAGILDELRRREVVRSSNGPAGDYAELLFSRAFGWTLETNSSAGYDAVDDRRLRYQIKCRRVSARNPSRQLSALRNLLNDPFDILAAVLLDENFDVSRAALIPISTVIEKSVYTRHVNAHRFMLRDSVWAIPGVVDVTEKVRQAQLSL
ncbi:hypothetical protein [Pleomorphomonas koreensis]|uniref:hypothetical protein n=1 Tax=Pleomorphomonas koreensis TaxID=257440 RepID=UPI000428E3F2|nr:hypothetical protein [Pleomorphomonas koreensis]